MLKKTWLSWILVLAMALTMAVPAMAEEESLEGKLVIIHTNDIHGRAVAVAEDAENEVTGIWGYAAIAQLKKDYEEAGASVLLFDVGDAAQGMPIVNLSMGAQAIEFMNAAGYDAMSPGNHEFDWGLANLQQIAEEAQFPILAANIVDSVSGETIFAPNAIFEMENGMQVGVFGLDTPETMTKAHPDKVKGITFFQEEELYACAQEQVDALTEAGCDVIVCLGHLGVDEESAPNRSTDLLEKVTGIDVFLDGHSHTEISEMVGDTLLESTGQYGENVGVVEYDGETFSGRLIPAAEYAGSDETVAALVNGVDAEVQEQLSAVFATTEVDLNGEREPGVRTEETNLGDFASDAILWQAQQSVGDQVVAAVTNGGGIRASIPAGDISMNDMKTVFPYGNMVVTFTVTGAELLEAIEAATAFLPASSGAFPQVAGIVFTVDTSVEYVNGEMYPNSTYYAPANPGSRVTIESVGGEAFDPEALYTIASNDFTAAGGDTYYAFAYPYANSGIDTGVSLEDALINYTTEVLGGVVGEEYAQPQGRITVK